ncbi:MAG: hypothetical protein M1817_004226 [Caeruleum heppii]|nr:MAG: hypothetical protein M1817_004226 [Caeruleum heppii]
MAESLEDRLKSHADAFNGLLSLIPAKLYYGEDTSDQWQKKKQTKEEKRRAKMAKLDPDNAKTAKDVLDERASKRKREEEQEADDHEIGSGTEQPKEGLKRADRQNKKQKRDTKAAESGDQNKTAPVAGTDNHDSAPSKKTNAEKNKEKREKKRLKQAAKEQKKQKKQARKQEQSEQNDKQNQRTDHVGMPDDSVDEDGDGELGNVEVSGMVEEQVDSTSAASLSPTHESPIFDAPVPTSGTSSISSIVPPAEEKKSKKLPTANPEELKARLQARIDALRAARKADGPNGMPARNRQELMDTRRKKEEERRAHKKDLRLKAKEEERLAREKTIALHSSPDLGSPYRSPMPEPAQTNFSFGRVAFSDGQQLDSSLNNIITPGNRKGPRDPLGALKVAEKKDARLNGFDENKRKDLEEKDLWLNARKRAQGESIRDDTNLLKKTLKRKEKAKKKSEGEWKERIEGVQKSKDMRQKKREGNLKKRREEKGVHGKKKKGVAKKIKKRPGFEGSFKGK